MAALGGMQVDNCEVWVDRPEIPGCDGSAQPFAAALAAAGIVAQAAFRPVRFVRAPIRLGNADSWIEARPCRTGKTILQYELDYGAGNPIGRQSLEVTLAPRVFPLGLAPARTFMLEAEALALRAQGLGQRTTAKDLLVFNRQGPVDNTLRFPDECVRHKLVDLVGDLALAGSDIVGRLVAYRSGHRLNAAMVRELVAREEAWEETKRVA
jgi:UDP-3-O-acyl-N-acetylglucosamine deacetylase